jgi:hypothetical protein
MRGAISAFIVCFSLLGQSPAEERDLMEMFQHAVSAKAHLFLGEYGAALADAREAHRRLEMNPKTKRSSLALIVLGARGAVHLFLEEPQLALTVFEEGDELARDIVNNASDDPKDLLVAHYELADFYGKMAVAQLLLDQAEQAQRTIDKAIVHASTSGLKKFLGLDRLKAQIDLQRSGGSREGRRRALTILISADDLAGGWLLQLGDSLTPSELSRLLREFPQVLALASPADRIQLHAGLALALGSAGDEKGRVEHDIAAIEIIERSRIHLRDTQALSGFFAPQVKIYDDVVSALYRKAKRNEAVEPSLLRFGRTYAEAATYFSEAAHSRQFSERYGPALIDAFGLRAGLPAATRDREHELREAMGRAAGPAFDLFTAANPVAVRQRSEQATQTYLDFLESLALQYPEFAASVFPRPVAIGRLPQALNDRFIVLYKVTDAAVYWWIIQNSEIVAFGNSNLGRAELTAEVASFRTYTDDDTVAAPLAGALVREPFGRIERIAAARPGGPPRVVIVPDEALYLLPWEALPAPRGGYVGDVFITSYAPSLTALAQAFGDARPPAAQKTALVIGNVQDRTVTIPIGGKPRQFPQLAQNEVRRVISTLRSQGYNVVSLEHANATPETLLARDQTPYALVHFDTHGFAEKLYPPPSLILHESSASPYGLLTLADILKLKLHAQLVTLSACETSLGDRGEPLPGEGVQSLARMFMLAGSKSVLASLWEADPAATAALMERFYEQLGPIGSDEAAALFRAKAAVRRVGFDRPSQWAPFILIGRP